MQLALLFAVNGRADPAASALEIAKPAKLDPSNGDHHWLSWRAFARPVLDWRSIAPTYRGQKAADDSCTSIQGLT